jgi:hypothetical protein
MCQTLFLYIVKWIATCRMAVFRFSALNYIFFSHIKSNVLPLFFGSGSIKKLLAGKSDTVHLLIGWLK